MPQNSAILRMLRVHFLILLPSRADHRPAEERLQITSHCLMERAWRAVVDRQKARATWLNGLPVCPADGGKYLFRQGTEFLFDFEFRLLLGAIMVWGFVPF
jgi:hypothetical protein